MKHREKNNALIIQITFSNNKTHQACFAENRVRIGRRSENEIVLTDPDVSRYHAEILSENNTIALVDRNSFNGVSLNGAKILRSELKKGDVIEIGRNYLTFEPAMAKIQEGDICLERGSEYLNQGKADLATGAFLRASRVQLDDPNTYLLLARAYLEQDRFKSANLIVEKCVILAPKSPEGYFLKGLIQDRQGKWLESKKYYEKCLELDTDYDAARKRLAILKEKAGLYEKLNTMVVSRTKEIDAGLAANWANLESGPFKIKFHLAEEMDNIKKVIHTLLRAHQKIGDKLGHFPQHVPVEIYSNFLEFGHRIGNRNEEFARWVAGVTGDAIIVHMNPKILKDPPFLYMILTHEYVHFLLHDMTRGNCPFWLGEGLAQFESQNLSRSSAGLLKKAAEEDYLLPLELLEGPFELLEEESIIKLAYAQSFSVVEYIIEFQGLSWLNKTLQNLVQGQSPASALANLGKSYNELEQDWSQWLKARNEIN